jgi:hypothetical protein
MEVMSTRQPDRDVHFRFRDGVPERDIFAHLISREGFLRLLMDDPQVMQLYRTFGNLVTIMSPLAQLADVVARECGWRDRQHMYAEPKRYAHQSPHWDAFEKQVSAFPWDRLSTFNREAEPLIHGTWRLPREHARERWGWLTDDLRRLLILALEDEMCDRLSVMAFDAQRGASPTLDVSFKTGTNESTADARRRLRQLYEESDAALGPVVPEPQHRGTILDEDRLRRDVEWFYRNQIQQPRRSQRWLASAYVEQQRATGTTLSPDQHDTISSGIKRARKLLSEIPA